MTIEDTLAKYGPRNQAVSFYSLIGEAENIFPMFLSFKRHFGWACQQTGVSPEEIPTHLNEAGYDFSVMSEARLLEASACLVNLSVPQLYTGDELIQASHFYPHVLICYEYVVRNKATGETVDNQIAWLKAGHALNHEKFLTPEARVMVAKDRNSAGECPAPSLFRYLAAVGVGIHP